MGHNRGGRKPDAVWQLFNRFSIPNRKGFRAECKTCGFKTEGQTARLHDHLKKCVGEPNVQHSEDRERSTATKSELNVIQLQYMWKKLTLCPDFVKFTCKT